MKQIILVYTAIKHFPQVYYYVEEPIKIGDWVEITFKNQKTLSLVIKILSEKEFMQLNLFSVNKLKIAKKTLFSVSVNFILYIHKFVEFNLLSTTYIIKHLSNLIPKKNFKIQPQDYKFNLNELNEAQKIAYEKLSQTNKISVLWGVTGSGKTEVFLHLIKDVLLKHQQVLVLLPEIALSEAMSHRFHKALGVMPIIWNSTYKNKKDFFRIMSKENVVVLGSRCAILLPFANLGLIVVDEEHDKSYKQNNQYAYNSKHMATVRHTCENIPVILASATPSMETFYQITINKYDCIKLENRFELLSKPTVTIRRLEDEILCDYVIERCKEELNNNKKVLFFLNRRGYAFIVKCKKCKNRLKCTQCESMLVLHKYINCKKLLCHRCNKSYLANYCFLCKNTNCLYSFGLGIQSLEEYLHNIFNQASILTLSSSNTEDITQVQNVNIIIGTQVIAKGHNFPALSLVIIVNMDGSNFDFRCSENTLQTLFQVSGRAGRSQMKSSEIIIQTNRNIEQVQYLVNMDYESFLKKEIESRQQWRLPPFTKLIALRFIEDGDSVHFTKFLPSYIEKIQQNIKCDIIGPLIYNKRISIILRIENTSFLSALKKLPALLEPKILVDVSPEEIL